MCNMCGGGYIVSYVAKSKHTLVRSNPIRILDRTKKVLIGVFTRILDLTKKVLAKRSNACMF